MAELWCPFAMRWYGPPQKQGTGGQLVYPKRGEVKHSAEGGWEGAHSVLANLGVSSSWHFTVGYDHIEQHYQLDANCWHANDTDPDGLVRGNFALVGVEHLGIAGEPLTPYQVDATIRLSRWMAEASGRSHYGRYPAQFQLWTMGEHNEIGNDPTACPSGRIPWEKVMSELGALPNFGYGDKQAGAELRGTQHVFWVGGVEVLSIGDPEGVGMGRLAKNFGPEDGFEVGDVWYWLRKGPNGEAVWSREEGD